MFASAQPLNKPDPIGLRLGNSVNKKLTNLYPESHPIISAIIG